MKKKRLIPRKVVDSEGKVAYSESSQAWNVIKLKKELFSEFPELKEKRSKFSYELIYHRDFKELEKTINRLDRRSVLPILMFLYKVG